MAYHKNERADSALRDMSQSAQVTLEEFQKMVQKVIALQADLNRIEKMVNDQYVIEEMEP